MNSYHIKQTNKKNQRTVPAFDKGICILNEAQKILQEMEGGGRMGGNGKIIRMYYVHVPTPHSESKHYVLQTQTNKKYF